MKKLRFGLSINPDPLINFKAPVPLLRGIKHNLLNINLTPIASVMLARKYFQNEYRREREMEYPARDYFRRSIEGTAGSSMSHRSLDVPLFLIPRPEDIHAEYNANSGEEQ